MRSLYSGVTGIRAHQVRMDVIGNNIANVNTTGFKASRVTFTDVMSQTISSGSQLTNPVQIGLGVGVGSTDLIQDDGAFQMTGRALDLAIEGSGLFVLRGADGGLFYTRAGSFDWNADGYLINPATGMYVQGWMADADGQIGRTDMGTMTDIRMIRGDVSPAKASEQATLKGNLDAAAGTGTIYATPITAYDSLGRPVEITLLFRKSGPNTWECYAITPDKKESFKPDDDTTWGESLCTLTFDNANGKLSEVTLTNPPPDSGDSGDGTDEDEPNTKATITIAADENNPDFEWDAAPLNLTIDFKAITQAFTIDGNKPAGENSTVQIDTIDGYPMGILQSVYVNESGIITGRYSNGRTKVLAQIALANFNNMAGLTKVGSSTFAESPASGRPQIGAPNTGGRGGLLPGNLEGSNVDLAAEFTNLILTQRGFQANTRVVTTSDEMLQELINMRR